MKQTAVDFLYEFVQLKLTNEQQAQFEGLFQQAKAMDEKQRIEANNLGVCKCGEDRIGETKLWCCNQCGNRCEEF